MIDINNVTDDFLIDTSDNSVLSTEDVKDGWPWFSKKERQLFYTVYKKHVHLDANKVLSSVVSLVTADGYKGMTDGCLNTVTKEQIDQLQDILDDITSNPSWNIYYPDQPINPDIEVEGRSTDENDDILVEVELS